MLDIEIRQRTGHCMRRHVTSEREPCAFEKKKSYEAKQLSQNCGNARGIIQHCVDFLCNRSRKRVICT